MFPVHSDDGVDHACRAVPNLTATTLSLLVLSVPVNRVSVVHNDGVCDTSVMLLCTMLMCKSLRICNYGLFLRVIPDRVAM